MNEDIKVIVDKHFLILFSIGKIYFNNLCCDVVAMDACHIYCWASHDNMTRISCMTEDVIHMSIWPQYKSECIVLSHRKDEEIVEHEGKNKLFLSRFVEKETKKEEGRGGESK